MKKTYQRLPESELDIMLVLWNNTPPMTRPEIEKVINTKKKLASTTILSLLTRLENKNFVEVTKQGKMNLYTPLVSQSDGLELLRRMRADAKLADIPIVMATAKGAEYDRIRGLDLGADYYLVKPFGVMELVSCVKAVLRRCGAKTTDQLRADGLVLDETEHTVTVDGERVALTYKEFELLRLFLSHPGTAFSRDQLMADVWGTDYCGETRTVDMHIRTLRQKLGPYGERIETVRGVGYRMEGRV